MLFKARGTESKLFSARGIESTLFKGVVVQSQGAFQPMARRVNTLL